MRAWARLYYDRQACALAAENDSHSAVRTTPAYYARYAFCCLPPAAAAAIAVTIAPRRYLPCWARFPTFPAYSDYRCCLAIAHVTRMAWAHHLRWRTCLPPFCGLPETRLPSLPHGAHCSTCTYRCCLFAVPSTSALPPSTPAATSRTPPSGLRTGHIFVRWDIRTGMAAHYTYCCALTYIWTATHGTLGPLAPPPCYAHNRLRATHTFCPSSLHSFCSSQPQLLQFCHFCLPVVAVILATYPVVWPLCSTAPLAYWVRNAFLRQFHALAHLTTAVALFNQHAIFLWRPARRLRAYLLLAHTHTLSGAELLWRVIHDYNWRHSTMCLG